jgi:hypothetical protein
MFVKLEEILSLDEQKTLVESTFFEMANWYPNDTGLNYVIWFGEVGGQHGPRIKVSNIKGTFAKHDNFVMSISKEPVNLTPKFTKISSDDVDDIKDWIKLNYAILMKLWEIYETGNGSAIEQQNKLEKL